MQDAIIRAVCVTLLHSLWQAVLLAAAAGTLLTLTRRAGSALRYKFLCTLMLFFVAVVGYTFCVQLLSGQHTGGMPGHSSLPAYGNSNVSQRSTPMIVDSQISKWLEACTYFFNQYSWLLVSIWFVFFLFRFVKLLLGMVNVDRLRYYKTNMVADEWEQKFGELCNRLHIKQPVLLMESAVLKIPVLIGYLKPVILIPAGMLTQLSAEQVEVILLHELAHVRRHDYLVNLVQNGIDTLFFFNPAILWISALIRSERESCCDDIAVLETKNRRQFIQALISFNQYSSSLRTCSLSWLNGGKGQLLRRVQRIVTNKNSSLRSVELVALLSATLLGSSAFMVFHNTRPLTTASPQHTTAAHPQTIPPNPSFVRPKSSISSVHTISTIAKKSASVATVATTKKPVLEKNKPALIPAIPAPVPAPAMQLNETTPNIIISQEQARLQEQLAALNYYENKAARLQTFIDHGVTASFIKSFIEAGYNNIPMDQLLDLRDHGVHAGFTKDLKKSGYGTVSLQQATTLVDHGVSVDFIEAIKSLGFNSVSLQQAIDLKDHGVTRTFIEAFKNKSTQLLSLEDYIKLKDSGINPFS